jgi:hypothetical protein
MLYALVIIIGSYNGGADVEPLFTYPDEESCKVAQAEVFENAVGGGIGAATVAVTCIPAPPEDDE